MKKFIFGLLAATLVLGGLWALTPKPLPGVLESIGASASPDHYEYHQFFAGEGTAFLKDLKSGSSSSSPAALTSSMSGHFVIAAAATTGSASTTAVTASSDKVFLQQEDSTPIAGTTCNTSAIASGTKVSLKVVSATSTSNGFVVTVPAAPVTNPYCYSYLIVK